MLRLVASLLSASGCASLLGIEDLGERGGDGAVDVQVAVDRAPAEMVDVVSHDVEGEVFDRQPTDVTGRATVAIPAGGAVSVMIEISPTQLELRSWFDLEDGDFLAVDAVSATRRSSSR